MNLSESTGLVRVKLSQKAVQVLNMDDNLMTLTDSYDVDVEQDGYKIDIPTFGSLGAARMLTDGGSVTIDSTATGTIQLELDLNAYKAFSITDRLARASYIDPLKYLESAATEIKLRMNSDVLAQAWFAANTIGVITDDISEATFVEAKTKLDLAQAPATERYAVLSINQFNKIAALDAFKNNNYITSGATDATGNIAWTFYGFNIVKNSTLVNTSLFFQKEGIASAKNKDVGVEMEREVKSKRTDYVVDAVYGVKTKVPAFLVAVTHKA